MLILALLQGNPVTALAFIIGLVFAITIHEAAHAFVAYRLGDPTAKLAGRLTLDPRSHLDPIGTLALLLVGFGWGRPTPFDPFNLRNVKRDSALISLAGAVSNFVLAFLISIPYLIMFFTNSINAEIINAYRVLSPIILINLLLGTFNLIPVHPLDGFKVLAGILPRDWYRDFIQTERYGIFILILLLATNMIGRILYPIVSFFFGILMPRFTAPF